MLVASTTYVDKGNSFQTEGLKSVGYMIYNATGVFKGKSLLTIYFYNDIGYGQRRIIIS